MDRILLEESCEILDSRRIPITASNRKEGPYPYYGANGIQDYVDDYIFDDELVLLAEDGGNFGSKERPIAYRVSGKCWVNNHAHVLKPKENIDVDYLCYSLMFYDTGKLVNGATRQKLTQTMMRKMLIQKRTMFEQKKIVAILNTIYNLLEHQAKKIEILDNIIKARFVEMFDGEQCAILQDLSDRITDGSHLPPKGVEKSDYLMLSSQNVFDEINRDGARFLLKEDFENENRRTDIKDGDVLVTIVGTIGRTHIVRSGEKYVFQRSVGVIKPKSDRLNSVYLASYLQTCRAKAFLTSRAHGSSQKGIYLQDLKKLPVPLVPMALQNEFATFVAQVDKSKFAVQKSLEKTQLLFDSLMQEYFR